MCAQIRYHYGRDPENMTEDEIIKLHTELKYIRQEEAKRNPPI